jgi:hypothetical protein
VSIRDGLIAVYVDRKVRVQIDPVSRRHSGGEAAVLCRACRSNLVCRRIPRPSPRCDHCRNRAEAREPGANPSTLDWKGGDRNLTEAVISGAKVIEQVIVDNLTEKEAHKLEYDHLREYVLAGKREQLWNVIPPSIRTPQEFQEFKEKLQRNLNSRDRLIAGTRLRRKRRWPHVSNDCANSKKSGPGSMPTRVLTNGGRCNQHEPRRCST